MSLTIYRKYRPDSFADVVGQEHVKTTLMNQLTAGSVAHAYLFTGPRGIGKTTVARLLAKAVNCEDLKKGEPCHACPSCKEIAGGAAMDVVEIDAATYTKVEDTRENIIAAVRFAPVRLKRKVYIIDEVHMFSNHSFNALLKTLEEPPIHAVFILATTEIQKVPETIISRCQRFDFRRLSSPELVARLEEISKAEGITVAPEVLAEVARHAEGCARDAESLLGQLFALGEKTIGVAEAALVMPSGTIQGAVAFAGEVLSADSSAAIRRVNAFAEQGIDMPHFADDVIAILRGLLFLKLGDKTELEALVSGKTLEDAQAIMQKADVAFLRRATETILDARRHMKSDRIPQLALELAAIRLSDPSGFQNEGAASARPASVGKKPSQVTPITNPSNNAVIARKESPTDLSTVALAKVDEATPLVTENLMTPAPIVSSEPLLASGVILDSVPVVSLDEVKRKWPDVFQQIKECNASLPMMVQAGEVSGVDGDEIQIHFAYKLYADALNKQVNRSMLETAVTRVLGRPLRIMARHVRADDVVGDLLKEFGGSAA